MIGIKSAVVALLAQKAEVNYDKSVTNVVTIVKHITELGFQATVLEDNAQGFSIVELAVSKFLHESIKSNFHVIMNCFQIIKYLSL